MKKKILITWGLGYIGSHAVVAFEQAGYQTVILDNLSNSCVTTLRNIQSILGYKPEYFECDLRDRKSVFEIFETHDFDWVLHFAWAKAVWESCEQPIYYFQNNISGSLFLFEAMEKYSVKNIIFSSSATVYENTPDISFTSPQPSPLEEKEHKAGICETDKLGTTNPYGTTKLLLEKILEDLSQFSGFNVINLRYFNPIWAHPSGKLWEDPDGIPNNLLPFIMKVANGELSKLNVFGDDYDTIDGTWVRDYIDVNDLVEGHLLAYKKLEEKGSHFCDVFNLWVGKWKSVLEMLEASRKITGQEILHKISSRREGDVAEVFCNPSKAREELWFLAKVSLEESLENSWKFYKK